MIIIFNFVGDCKFYARNNPGLKMHTKLTSTKQ